MSPGNQDDLHIKNYVHWVLIREAGKHQEAPGSREGSPEGRKDKQVEGIGKKVRQAMIVKEVTQVQVAGQLGLSVQTIRNQFHRDAFTVKTAARIADLLDCDIALKDRTTGKIYE